MDHLSSEKITARRPDLFRALGASEPPDNVSVNGRPCRLLETLKHDSWAATVVYSGEGGAKWVCKFGRTAPFPFGIPGAWIGRWLAGREEKMLRALAGKAGFPRCAGPVSAGAAPLRNAVSHEWIPGRPFEPSAEVGDHFFPRLREMLRVFHGSGAAYLDMSKWGNILIGDDGLPYLLDYQIYFKPPRSFPWGFLLRQAQAGDRYYLNRHWRRCRPDQLSAEDLRQMASEPFHVWLAERAGPFFRGIRLLVLRLWGVKGDPRKVTVASPKPALAARCGPPGDRLHRS